MSARSSMFAQWTVAAFLFVLAGCAATPEPGWQATLASAYEDRAADFAAGARLLAGFDPVGADTDPAAGDTLLYGIRLDTGGEPRIWYLRIRIDAIQVERWLELREVTDFEDRVTTPRARQREAEYAAKWAAEGRPDFDSFRQDVPVAHLHVEAFDASLVSLGAAESKESLRRLRIGLWSACVAGHAHRELLRRLYEPIASGEPIEVDDGVYAGIQTVAQGVASCRSFFELLKQNPVTKNILYEVIALPTLWSIVVNWGVRPGFRIDFAGASPLASGRLPMARSDVWSVPMSVVLNNQPALLACVFAAQPQGAAAAAAGVQGLIGRHPTDARRRVQVQLLASRRAERR